jgi:hypothetical protein
MRDLDKWMTPATKIQVVKILDDKWAKELADSLDCRTSSLLTSKQKAVVVRIGSSIVTASEP